MNTLKLSGQVAIITGATSGIGKATALLFASQGAVVLMTKSMALDHALQGIRLLPSNGTLCRTRGDLPGCALFSQR